MKITYASAMIFICSVMYGQIGFASAQEKAPISPRIALLSSIHAQIKNDEKYPEYFSWHHVRDTSRKESALQEKYTTSQTGALSSIAESKDEELPSRSDLVGLKFVPSMMAQTNIDSSGSGIITPRRGNWVSVDQKELADHDSEGDSLVTVCDQINGIDVQSKPWDEEYNLEDL